MSSPARERVPLKTPREEWPECADCGRKTNRPVEHSTDVVCTDCYYHREGL